MNSDKRAITVANDRTICEFIQHASNRLIILTPAMSKKVALVICSAWKRLGASRVSVILDLDPEVFRLGYGDFESLELLETTANELGTMVQRQPGIRIGLIVSDARTLVYTPTPALIEAGPSSADTPNAIIIEGTPPKVERELGHGTDGVKDQIVGLDKASNADIKKAEVELNKNPPQKFDVARTVRVFNAKFEFVEFEMTGTQIGRMTIPIPSELMGIAGDDQTKKRLKASFKIIDETDALSGSKLKQAKGLIVKAHLTMLPGYGNVVLRSVKSTFEEDVIKLRKDMEFFKQSVKSQLTSAMEKNREKLIDTLLPSAMSNPPAHWRKHIESNPNEDTMRKMLNNEIIHVSGSPSQLVNQMKIKLVFKAVTYELLSDEKFMMVAKEALPGLPELHTEYDAAKAKDIND